MSKYLCQDCKSNNNGWCVIRKCNGLKKLNITSCNTFENIGSIAGNNAIRGKRADLKPVDDYCDCLKDNSQAYRVLGKREMLWNVQMQIVAINKDTTLTFEDKYAALINNIKSIGIHLDFEEELWNVKDVINSIIDEDIVKSSKCMTNMI